MELADLPKRVRDKIRVEPHDCWTWTGSVNENGYGQAWSGGGRKDGRLIVAHRRVYELLVGKIPPGMDLDHECHNQDAECPGGFDCLHRRCVNPSHLSPTTRRDNLANGRHHLRDKTHCKHGHEFTKENTYVSPQGRRVCRACDNARTKKRYRERRARDQRLAVPGRSPDPGAGA